MTKLAYQASRGTCWGIPHPRDAHMQVKRPHADLFLSSSDYINPIDLCNRLNASIVPEAAVHAFLTILFLINGYWLALLLNLPLLAFNGKKYVNQARDIGHSMLTEAVR